VLGVRARRPPSTWPSWLLVAIWAHLGVAIALSLVPARSRAPSRGIALVRLTSADGPDPRAEPPRERAPVAVDPLASVSAPQATPTPPEPPAEEPPPESPPEDIDWTPYVRTDPKDEAARRPENPLGISARDAVTPAPHGTLVTADKPGARTNAIDGHGHEIGSPTPDLRPGPPNDPRAGVPTGTARHGADGGGGGRSGSLAGEGSPGLAGDRRTGGDTAPGGTGLAGASPPEAPNGAGIPSDDPAWWHPLAARVTVAVAAPEGHGDGGDPAPTRGAGRAIAQAPGDDVDRGGTSSLSDQPAAPGEVEQPSTSVLLRDDPGAMDPVDALREALGWGPLDRSQLGPRPAWAGVLGKTGADATSPQIDDPDLPVAWEPAVSVEGTPLGRYIEQLEDLVARRWSEVDLTTSEKAIGYAGRVTVRYRVWPDGRVTDRRVASSSGNLSLDTMALQAVPLRAPRFPRELHRDEPLWHQVDLSYRNPFIAVGL
jgi:TonB family protein